MLENVIAITLRAIRARVRIRVRVRVREKNIAITLRPLSLAPLMNPPKFSSKVFFLPFLPEEYEIGAHES